MATYQAPGGTLKSAATAARSMPLWLKVVLSICALCLTISILLMSTIVASAYTRDLVASGKTELMALVPAIAFVFSALLSVVLFLFWLTRDEIGGVSAEAGRVSAEIGGLRTEVGRVHEKVDYLSGKVDAILELLKKK